jgi:hypothetical protein
MQRIAFEHEGGNAGNDVWITNLDGGSKVKFYYGS